MLVEVARVSVGGSAVGREDSIWGDSGAEGESVEDSGTDSSESEDFRRLAAQPTAPAPAAAMGSNHHQADIPAGWAVGALAEGVDWAIRLPPGFWAEMTVSRCENAVEVGATEAARVGKGSVKALKPACAVLRSSSAATRVLGEYGIVSRGSEYSNCEDEGRLSLSHRADIADGKPGLATLRSRHQPPRCPDSRPRSTNYAQLSQYSPGESMGSRDRGTRDLKTTKILDIPQKVMILPEFNA